MEIIMYVTKHGEKVNGYRNLLSFIQYFPPIKVAFQYPQWVPEMQIKSFI